MSPNEKIPVKNKIETKSILKNRMKSPEINTDIPKLVGGSECSETPNV